MKLKAKWLKTPVGYYSAPINPHFIEDLEKCNTNEDLFNLMEENGFINPDAFNEVIVRSLYAEYSQWKRKKV